MNLVAKEYVAERIPRSGRVICHALPGGEQMREAVLINPHSAEEMADAIRQALRMPREERIARWRSLMDGILAQDVFWWGRRFTDALMPQTAAAA